METPQNVRIEKNKFYVILDYVWVIIAILIFIASIKYLNDGTLSAKVESLGIWGPITLILLKASTLVFAPLGGTPLYIVAGAVFGTIKGFIISFIGDVLGATICFYISSTFGNRVLEFFAGNANMVHIRKIFGLLKNTKSFIKARIAFISIPELVAYASGLSSISFLKFFILNTIFFIPFDLAAVFLGNQIAQFTVKYAVFVSLGAIVLAMAGVWLLSRDYRKVEGM